MTNGTDILVSQCLIYQEHLCFYFISRAIKNGNCNMKSTEQSSVLSSRMQVHLLLVFTQLQTRISLPKFRGRWYKTMHKSGQKSFSHFQLLLLVYISWKWSGYSRGSLFLTVIRLRGREALSWAYFKSLFKYTEYNSHKRFREAAITLSWHEPCCSDWDVSVAMPAIIKH